MARAVREMPRYKFSWTNLPHGLLHDLARGLGLEGAPDRALRATYGARPTVELVRDAWSILLDKWLTRDRGARVAVVEQLRDARLGKLDLPVGSAAEQMAYLRSCRNSSTLRDIVLDVFIAVGELQPQPVAGAAPSPDAHARGWSQFITALAHALSGLDVDQFLVLRLGDRPGFVQFAQQGPAGVRAELVSNNFLRPPNQLTADAIEQAVALGWQPPTGAEQATADLPPDGSPNFFRDIPSPVSYIDVARIAVETLERVLGVAQPSELTYLAFTKDGERIDLPGLGLRRALTEVLELPSTAGSPPTADAIRAVLVEAFRIMTGDPELVPDEDGDIAIRYGSGAVFVRVFGDPVIIRVFSPVLDQVSASPALLTSINNLNNQCLFTKWLLADASLYAVVELFGHPLEVQHVIQACSVVGDTIDHYDEQLQKEFGGKTFFGEYLPKPSSDRLSPYL